MLLVQIMLTQDADLVDGAARLLQQILAPVPGMPTDTSQSTATSTPGSAASASGLTPPGSAPGPSLQGAAIGATAVSSQAAVQPTSTAPALSRLYLTGALYFALSYTGSNLDEVAGLLRVAHLKQAFRSVQSMLTQ